MSNDQQLLKSLDDLTATYKISDIEELIIEDMYFERLTEKVKTKLESLVFLESMSFINCRLNSLEHLPQLDSLLRIQLDHNQLTVHSLTLFFKKGKDVSFLKIYPNLISISMMDNNIEQLEEMKNFANVSSLLQLNLFKNPVQNIPQYRQKVFEWLPKLILLDNLYQDGSEILLDDDQKVQDLLQPQKIVIPQTPLENKRRQQRTRAIADDNEGQDEEDQDSTSDYHYGKGQRNQKKRQKRNSNY